MELRTGRLKGFTRSEPLPADLERVPDDLQALAAMKIRFASTAGTEPVVNMRSQHPLAKWGRDKLKEKRKAKVAALSRSRNRK